jgi:hypothetical protein
MNIPGAIVLGAALLWLSRKTNRNPAASPEEIANRKREIAVFDERLAHQRRRLSAERNRIESSEIARHGRTLLVHQGTPELLAAQDAIKRLEAARAHASSELSYALQRNPKRAQTLDKLEAKTRSLAMDARGPSASTQSKAAYRRSLDALMQARIDAGVQRTLFDVEPSNNSQRALPGFFE